jgi:hypothetical protein
LTRRRSFSSKSGSRSSSVSAAAPVDEEEENADEDFVVQLFGTTTKLLPAVRPDPDAGGALLLAS